MAYAHITLSQEVPELNASELSRYMAQAICDATGKPEAYILVTVSRADLCAGPLPQSQVLIQLTVIGTDDPFRSEQISKFVCRRLLLHIRSLVPSQVNTIIRYLPRGNTSICGNLV